ncbi:ABC transporter permease (plasmid) [Rhizobium sp. CC1099]|uniref:ABC transporter permease n=1 Tax=Rhizobium sp. CC1099 TaxID=3039160 RepID=UPI0024B1726D|nr:ABC transporter permease [Rhizobium sp. CC1099]WFU91354.1 ABC transporter permease [Rhizobium sp. CC1099]
MSVTSEISSSIAEPIGRAHSRMPAAITVAKICALALLIGLAISTPGFLSRPSLIALANAISLVGCVALGMTLITLGGNIMSFSIGATASVTGIVFMATLGHGLMPAALAAILAGAAITALQGWIIGALRANPIIVSLATYALLIGMAQIVVGPKVDAPNLDYQFLKGRLGGVPVSFLLFGALTILCQLILTFTRFGHELLLVGSNGRAAEAAGIHVTRVTVVAYALAGALAGIGGIVIASRFGVADMQTARGFEYTAIAAVLIGGTSIGGGRGSITQTFLGMGVIAIINALALLQGMSMEFQRLAIGLAVLAVIILQGLGRRN